MILFECHKWPHLILEVFHLILIIPRFSHYIINSVRNCIKGSPNPFDIFSYLLKFIYMSLHNVYHLGQKSFNILDSIWYSTTSCWSTRLDVEFSIMTYFLETWPYYAHLNFPLMEPISRIDSQKSLSHLAIKYRNVFPNNLQRREATIFTIFICLWFFPLGNCNLVHTCVDPYMDLLLTFL